MDSIIFTDRWKTAKVTQIHKSNAQNDTHNYRPISVLPIVGKVFPRIAFDHLYTY